MKRIALATACMLCTAGSLWAPVAPAADSYPNRPVRLIIPYSSGGGDVVRDINLEIG